MKKKLFIILTTFYSTMLFCQIPSNGLVAHWSFDGNANDLSSSNNNGNLYGPILSTDRFGNANRCYSFDGINDYIETPVNNIISDQYSYSAWALTNTLPNTGTGTYVLFVGGWGSSQVINTNNNVGVNNGWGGNGYNTSNPIQYITYQGSSLTTNQWVHIVLTRSANVMKLYINCNMVKKDSTSFNTLPYYGSNPILKIGTRDNNTGYFDGKIDDIRIYNRAISQSEVCELYNEPNPDPNTVNIKEIHDDVKFFNLSPNPAMNNLTVNFNSSQISENGINYSIYSTDSKIVKTQKINKTINDNFINIDTSDLAKGIYLINISSGKINQNLLFIKE